MAAIVQRLERLIVVQDVVGSNPTSRPISSLDPGVYLFLSLRPNSVVTFPTIPVKCASKLLVPAY